MLQIARQFVAEPEQGRLKIETTYDWQQALDQALDRLVDVLLTIPMPERRLAIDKIVVRMRLPLLPGAPAPTRH